MIWVNAEGPPPASTRPTPRAQGARCAMRGDRRPCARQLAGYRP